MTSVTWGGLGGLAEQPERQDRPVRRGQGGARSSTEVSADAPLRLTRRGRIVLVVAVALLVLLGARVGSAVAGSAGEPEEVRVHVVAAGETLWDHAAALASPGEDLRDVVARIVELNGLSSSGLQAGQRLVLPVDE
ncbi:LysM peptidoglycan-binding domain-containing protein [Cellulosimicrobium sp. PMB13]|uniref:LysM peptidoglycan-binding domain-containing protein n=1 Tax=Cellulosimicrobium sp. PMB13 TaxID=3120158 RepID=UPI003F4B20B0